MAAVAYKAVPSASGDKRQHNSIIIHGRRPGRGSAVASLHDPVEHLGAEEDGEPGQNPLAHIGVLQRLEDACLPF